MKIISIRSALFVLALALTVTLTACSNESNSTEQVEPDGRLSVVTTVSPITSLVESIGGNRIRLEGIIPEGVNSHTYEPAPSVARLITEADLIVMNGLFLEEPALNMAEANKKDEAVILQLGDKTVTPEQWQFDFSFPATGGRPNPHLWPDPILGLKYAEHVRDELSRLDADNADYYSANYDALKLRIDELDQGIVTSVQTVPEGDRRLLTYHDSWAYFALRYGMSVIGAIQPSDFTEPSARDVAELIDQLRELKVPAIFGSEVFPSEVMEQIAKEGGAEFIDQLRDDDLPGAPGDARHSYFGLMLSNMEIMIEALGGNTQALADFDTGPVFEGESGAIYPQ
ncbi:MAG: metal ABC transporter substrate-binding protein [SAR202 cluster bacterium]|nr:metal ABC transporter substrate-binding protein [SAR202 cluster bacterium]MDP6514176.1 metal ABC transporter substrate-binding protein [SAR202 cluster bacterium]MDP6716972.1 metal ABC transporter substrate-binding protein [SAR202 cluster bacterium]